MAIMQPINGVNRMAGALSKKRVQGVKRFSNTRFKQFKDPLTGEVLKTGYNEIFLQSWRDYKTAPRTPAEQRQADKWRNACRQAQLLKNDRSHPRYAELYARWRAQIHNPDAIIQFGNFIRSVLAKEDCP